MSFFAALWLVLLHAIAGAVAEPLRPASAHGVGVRFETTQGSAPKASASPARTPMESLRPARTVGSMVVARAGARVPVGNDGATSALLAPPPACASHATLCREAGPRDGSHRLPSRGSLLPYYPTAPPRPA